MSVKISALPQAASIEVTDQIPVSKNQGETKKVLYSMIVSDMNGRFGSYDHLSDKPTINNVPLEGDLTTEQLGIFAISSAAIENICT